MEKQSKDFAGKNGFIWFIGVVEDRKDPLKLGRCKVRCIGWHSPDKTQLPTNALPWAETILPLSFSNMHTPLDGDMVLGFFKDGENAQEPVMMGIFPKIPLKAGNAKNGFNDSRSAAELASSPVKPGENASLYPRKLDEPTTSRLARNDANYPSPIVKNKKDKKESKVEPDPYYNAAYPFNNVYESESGHALEFDDTKGAERVHVYHRSGSYTEWGPEGDRAERIQRNKFEVVVGNEQVYVKGDVTIFVDGNVKMDVGGNFQADIGGTCKITSGGNMTLKAPRIDLN